MGRVTEHSDSNMPASVTAPDSLNDLLTGKKEAKSDSAIGTWNGTTAKETQEVDHCQLHGITIVSCQAATAGTFGLIQNVQRNLYKMWKN